MTPADFDSFRDGVSGVYAFYGKDVSRFALDVWWKAMQPFDIEAVTDAFNRHLVNPDSGEFLPKPANIVKMLRGSTVDRAMVAWSKVDRAVRMVGAYASVAFDDPLIHRVLQEMGGWVWLGKQTDKDWPFIAKDFETRYRGYVMRSELPDYAPVLIGMSEMENSTKGYPSDEPRLIGDQERARRVMNGGKKTDLLRATPANEVVQKLVGKLKNSVPTASAVG